MAWTPDLSAHQGPRYLAIVAALAAAVTGGILPAGARLPTHRDLAERLGVTVGTVTRAYQEAARRGLVSGTVGRGTYVRGDSPRRPDTTDDHAVAMATDHRRAFDRVYVPGTLGTGVVDLSLNYPVADGLAVLLRDALRQLDDLALLDRVAGYQPSTGRPEHRQAGAAWLARHGIAASADTVVLTPGGQAALLYASLAFSGAGDVILSEELTWPGWKAQAHSLGRRLVGVAMDQHGMRPDALAEAVRRTGARLVYLMPTLHNPTTITMSLERRHEIAAVARAHDLVVIEDDIYGFLATEALAPLAALAPERTLYAASLSKALAPALRIGYLHAPASWIPPLVSAIRATTIMASPLMAEAARSMIESGSAAAAVQAQREESAARQRLAATVLPAALVAAQPYAFHLWLRLPPPWRTADFVAQALARGVAVTGGDSFVAAGDADPQAVRVCVAAAPDRKRLRTALGTLADLLRGPASRPLPVV